VCLNSALNARVDEDEVNSAAGQSRSAIPLARRAAALSALRYTRCVARGGTGAANCSGGRPGRAMLIEVDGG
jgi:hypothetical protein